MERRKRRDAGGVKADASGGQVERRRQEGGGGEPGGAGRRECAGRVKTEREDPCEAQGADVDAPESQGGQLKYMICCNLSRMGRVGSTRVNLAMSSGAR